VKYRGVAIGAALVVIVVAVVLWHRQRPDESSTTHATGSAGHVAAGRIPLARDRPRRPVAGVVLLDGAAAPGIAVRIDDTAPVLSDASGHFDLGVQRIARHVVIAEPPRLAGAFAAIDLADPTVDAEHVTLMLHACTASLHGTVRDAAGGAIAHARVALSSLGSGPGAGTEAGDDGGYDLCLSPGSVEIVVSADGYATESTPLQISGRVRRDFQLIPEAPVVGRVVRAQDREPVPGAEVMLFSEDMVSGFVFLHATASDDGRFRVTGAPPGRFSIVAWADHLASAQPVPVVAELGAPTDEILCEVVPAPTVSGIVLEDGKPAAGAHVSLTPTNHRAPGGWTPAEAVSAADGTFAIASVQPGTYNAWVSSEQIAQSIGVKASDVTGVTLAIARKASISGVVTHDGKPVEGADVHTDYDGMKSDATGHFTLRGLSPGAHQIYAESNRLGVFTPGPTITVAAGEQKTDVEIEMGLAGSIAGVVVDQDGDPVSGAAVMFSLVHGKNRGTATTAEDGTFIATGLSGGGEYAYEVTAREATFSFRHYTPADGKRFAPVAVRDGQTHVTGVRIRVHRDHGTVAGHVTTTAGAPVVDAAVRVYAKSPGVSFATMTIAPPISTDAAGAFAFHDLPAGPFTVTATTPHGKVSADDVAVGTANLVLQIEASGTIDGTLVGFREVPDVVARRDGEPGAGYRAFVTGSSFTIRDVPPGGYVVSAGDMQQHVELAAGGRATVTLSLLAPGAVTGTVLDEHQQPVAGVPCGAGTDFDESVVADAAGRFRIDGVPAGVRTVFCGSQTMGAWTETTIIERQTAHVDLVARPLRPRPSRAGFQLERQFMDVVVASVEPGGPAEKAGVMVGDYLVSAAGMMPVQYLSLQDFEELSPGTVVQLTLERGDKQLTVSLTLAAR
jgi:hypothetical protein